MLKQTGLATRILFFAFLFSGNIAEAQKGGDFTASKHQGWLVNVDEAYELSKKTNRPVLANFTGSDWCGWCIRLRKEVFNKPSFMKWATDNVILLELDYPKRKELPDLQAQQNAQLQQAFAVTGFPTIWMFDLVKPEENARFEIQPYGKSGYMPGGPVTYIHNLERMITLKGKGIN